jgi:hypothetical protein
MGYNDQDRMFHLKHNPNNNCIVKVLLHQYNNTNEFIAQFIFVRKNLQNSFTADAENVHQFLKHKHPPKILLPVGVLLSYLVLSFQNTH